MEGHFVYGNITLYYIVPEGVEFACYLHGSKEMAQELAGTSRDGRVGILAVSGEDWNRDLSPWAAPAVFQNSSDFSGGAKEHLSFLREKVIPETEAALNLRVKRRALMGYSLAGLFALYAMYQTNLFTDIASVSGSLWYDGFIEYMKGREPAHRPDRVYLSLGNKEKNTKNPRMRQVEVCTEEVQAHLCGMGIDCVFEKNAGNHFYQEAERMQRALAWLCDREDLPL